MLSALIEIGAKILEVLLKDQTKRSQAQLQMYEFIRRFDADAIEGNAKLRAEYQRLKKELERYG